jgi:hypothetical protein
MFTAAVDEIVHRSADIDRTSGGAENCPTLSMDIVHQTVRDDDRLHRASRFKPGISAPESNHLSDPVAIMQLQKKRANHVVQARDKARRTLRFRRASVSDRRIVSRAVRPARTGTLVLRQLRSLRDSDVVADGVSGVGFEGGFA